MRYLIAAFAALLLGGCAHPLEVRNLDQYSSLERQDPLERQTAIGVVVTAPDEDSQRLGEGIGKALGRYSAKVVLPYSQYDAGKVAAVARLQLTPAYEGKGSNIFVNFPGLLVLAPTWKGYSYKVDYEIQVLLTRSWDNSKIDAWTMPVSLDVRHSSGMLLSTDYNPEVTAPTVDVAGDTVSGYVAREIVRRLNSEGRLWKLDPPPEWVPPQPPPPPPPPKPVVVAPPVPAPGAAVPLPKPVPKAAPKPVKKAPVVPKVLATGGWAKLRSGGMVRQRPLMPGDAAQVGGDMFVLGNSMRNAAGKWWYVTAGDKGGWVLEADLQPSAPPEPPAPPEPVAPPPAGPTPAPSTPAPEAAPSMPVPAPTPPAPTRAPAPDFNVPPEPTSTPPSSSAVAPFTWKAGSPARLRSGAVVRTRSAPDADAAKSVDASGPVTLKAKVSRPTGNWWYVTTPAGSGWVLESDLVTE